ncbi:MAG: hypothetical protein CVU18_04240 [Betaproteobacteria bacterium HGW-Betaproteobacteria-12]|nr:MAG: hypothetical protein CVU18_04240 [Betaproteobacteria bacterium HGW-Betaproteobacteria-12]
MAIKIQNVPNRAAFDVKSAQDLRTQFAKNPQEGLKAASQQFEQMFLQMVMKSMRDTVPQDGLLNSDQSRFYTALLDQQMAQNLASSGNGIGFARLIEQQLGRTVSDGKELAAPGEAANAAGNSLPPTVVDSRHLRHTPVPGTLPTSAAYVAPVKAAVAAVAANNADVPATARDLAACRRGLALDRHPAAVPGRPIGAGERLGAQRAPSRRWLVQP